MSIDLKKQIITTDAERLYLFRNSTQINAQTGFQGHLQGAFFQNHLKGDCDQAEKGGFYPCFIKYQTSLHDDFFNALQEVMDTLREDGFLRSFPRMKEYCLGDAAESVFSAKWADPGVYGQLHTKDVSSGDVDQYGVRIDHKGISFFFRLCPKVCELGDYQVYVYCYRTDWLSQHMEKAKNGIRFIDGQYQEKFRLKDGGKIRITTGGNVKERVCRYIDDYHVEIGGDLYHICEYAERREAAGDRVDPVATFRELMAYNRANRILLWQPAKTTKEYICNGWGRKDFARLVEDLGDAKVKRVKFQDNCPEVFLDESFRETGKE